MKIGTCQLKGQLFVAYISLRCTKLPVKVFLVIPYESTWASVERYSPILLEKLSFCLIISQQIIKLMFETVKQHISVGWIPYCEGKTIKPLSWLTPPIHHQLWLVVLPKILCSYVPKIASWCHLTRPILVLFLFAKEHAAAANMVFIVDKSRSIIFYVPRSSIQWSRKIHSNPPLSTNFPIYDVQI